MIGAAKEFAGIALSINDNLGAFVWATVEQHMDIIGFVAHLDNRLIANLRREIVALVRGLAFVADKNPSVGEDVLHLKRVDILINVNVAVNLMWLNKCAR
jgi:hypothetical protein